VEKAARPAIFKGGRPSPYSFCVRSVGICGVRSRSAMSRNCWLSAAWKRTIPPFGAGSVLRPELDQRLRRHLKPTNKSWRVGETYVRVKGGGATCIGPSIPAAPPSTSCYRHGATRLRPNDCSARRSATRRMLNLVSSTQTKRQSTSGDSGNEEGRDVEAALQAPTGAVLKQGVGTGSSSHQTTGESEARFSGISGGATDDPRVRSDAHDRERASAAGEWPRRSPPELVC